MTVSFDYYVLIILQENLCWSHLGFREISKNQEGQSVLVQWWMSVWKSVDCTVRPRYHFKPWYPLKNSPNWSPYISLKNKLREFDNRSRLYSFSGHFVNSHNHFSWQHMDIGRRKLMLVTIGTLRVNKDTEGAIESFSINRVSVLNGLNLEKL